MKEYLQYIRKFIWSSHDYSRALSARTEDLRHLGHCVRAVAE